MKLHVNDIQGPDALKAELCLFAVIMLNGVRQDGVIMADEENGVIERYCYDAKGKLIIGDDDNAKTELVYGRVRIKDVRDEYKPIVSAKVNYDR